ncbi:MAG: 3-oxoacyl-[acyl-carrier-protein] synthase 2 [Chloroflexi bacterium]|nr:3-oxoacyl-[acyl-carrier-protein] synthase 2 [Chloroflexota bacterium]
MKARRVVVTGMGVITPLGNDVASFWEALCAGQSGVGPITAFDASRFASRIAAEVRDFAPPPEIEPRDVKQMDRFALFGLSAALQAFRQSALAESGFDPNRAGVVIGSSHGGEVSLLREASALEQPGGHGVSPWAVPRMLANMASAQVAIHFGLHGPSFTLGSACATGAQAIGEAASVIRRGDADVMLCGGAEACITTLTIAGDDASGALSRRNDAPEEASRPFDVGRDGFVLGEGAGVLVIEELGHARRRDATILAELVGYGATTDAVHVTRPDPSGQHAARAMSLAFAQAAMSPSDVDVVFAHATSTQAGDRAEARALAVALGDIALTTPVTAIKSSLGHLLGAAGAVQAIAAIMALRTGVVPPTRNLEVRDLACPLNIVTGHAPSLSLRCVLTNAFGFGGHNVSLVFL